jgi:hypothetical protein
MGTKPKQDCYFNKIAILFFLKTPKVKALGYGTAKMQRKLCKAC